MTTLTAEQRTARKEHRCEWCAEPIVIGERHEYWVGIYDGDFVAQRMHIDCYRAAQDSLQQDWHEVEEYCGAVYPHPRGAGCSECAP